MTLTQATLTPNGAIGIPEEYRQSVGWQPGDVLALECDGDSVLVRRLDPCEGDEFSAER